MRLPGGQVPGGSARLRAGSDPRVRMMMMMMMMVMMMMMMMVMMMMMMMLMMMMMIMTIMPGCWVTNRHKIIQTASTSKHQFTEKDPRTFSLARTLEYRRTRMD